MLRIEELLCEALRLTAFRRIVSYFVAGGLYSFHHFATTFGPFALHTYATSFLHFHSHRTTVGHIYLLHLLLPPLIFATSKKGFCTSTQASEFLRIHGGWLFTGTLDSSTEWQKYHKYLLYYWEPIFRRDV